MLVAGIQGECVSWCHNFLNDETHAEDFIEEKYL